MLAYLMKLITKIFFVLTSVFGIGIAIFFYYGRALPDYDYLQDYAPVTLSYYYDAQDQLIKEDGAVRRIYTPLFNMPKQLIQAFLSAEDKNFYYHCGIDLFGLLRAMASNTLADSNRPGGGSTITQQVAKNFLLGNERSITRKIKEAIMSFRLENALTKERILELYLNEIYLGMGAYGVTQAALTYFNKSLNELTVDEMAFLAALPKAPSTYASPKDLERARQRRNWVIGRLAEEGAISQEDADTFKEHPLVIPPKKPTLPTIAPYFMGDVARESIQHLGSAALAHGGLKIYTTLDRTIQKAAEDALQSGLIAYDRRHGWRGPVARLPEETLDTWQSALQSVMVPRCVQYWLKAVVLKVTAQQAHIGLEDNTTGEIPMSELLWARPCLSNQLVGASPSKPAQVLAIGDVIWVSALPPSFPHSPPLYRLEQVPNITGAVVVMNPKNGSVLGLVGGFHFDLSQFNCATQAKRQPGSAFKPFVYLAALENGYTTQSIILDAPVSFKSGKTYYTPKNYTKKFYGPSPLRLGIEQSRNVMTVRLAQRIGMHKISDISELFGVISTPLPNQLAMALGAGETTVLRLTAAYGMISNGGSRIHPYFVTRIQSFDGDSLYESPRSPPSAPLVSAVSIDQMISMLEGVVERGTAKQLQHLNEPIAGKTGTTNDYKDAWFVGFSKDLVIGVFVGFSSPRTLGKSETGGAVAVPIVRTFFEKYRAAAQPTS